MMRMKQLCCTAILVLLVGQAAPVAELATKKALTLEVAKQIAAASGRFARKNQWNVVIAIVDDGGHLVILSAWMGCRPEASRWRFKRRRPQPLSSVPLRSLKKLSPRGGQCCWACRVECLLKAVCQLLWRAR